MSLWVWAWGLPPEVWKEAFVFAGTAITALFSYLKWREESAFKVERESSRLEREMLKMEIKGLRDQLQQTQLQQSSFRQEVRGEISNAAGAVKERAEVAAVKLEQHAVSLAAVIEETAIKAVRGIEAIAQPAHPAAIINVGEVTVVTDEHVASELADAVKHHPKERQS